MIGAVDAEDVLQDLLVQRALGHAEQLDDQRARELQLLGLEEEVDALAVQYEAPERRLRQPALRAQLAHARVEVLAAQGRIEIVELGELELRHQGHACDATSVLAYLFWHRPSSDADRYEQRLGAFHERQRSGR